MKCTFCENKSAYEYELNSGELIQSCETHRRAGFYASVTKTGKLNTCDYCKDESTHSYTCKDQTFIKTCDEHKLKGYYKSLKHDGKKLTYVVALKSTFPFLTYAPCIDKA